MIATAITRTIHLTAAVISATLLLSVTVMPLPATAAMKAAPVLLHR